MAKATRQPIVIGEKLGRLTVLEYAGNNQHGVKMYLCKCDCGNMKIAAGVELRRGHTRSCGCLFKEVQLATVTHHGLRKERIYSIWKDMRRRCNNPNRKSWKNYGGRGIKVCEEWKNPQSFYDWAMSNGYEEHLSIDRIDVNGDYSPENCRWATSKEQSSNQRRTIFLEKDGEIHTIPEWSEILGIKKSTIYSRLQRGCTNEMALIKPKEGRR